MSAIKDYNIARSSRNAVIELYHNLMDAVEQCATIKTKMVRRYNALKTVAANLFKAAEQTQKSDQTDPIFVLDTQRDILWTAINHAVLAQTKSLDEAIRTKAVSVQNTLNSLKVNTNGQYIRESGQMDTVLSVLLGAQLENVTAIGLLPLVQLLDNANKEMHRLVEERDRENAGKPAGAFAKARREAEEEYRTFVNYVNAYWIINVDEAGEPDEALEDFIRLWNTVIDRYNRTQFNHGSAGSEEEVEEEEVEEEETTEEETNPDNGGNQQPDNTPDTNPDDTNQGDNSQGGGSLTPDTNPPSGGDNTGGGNTNPGGGYVPPSNGGGFD